jgi:hypothetical protein
MKATKATASRILAQRIHSANDATNTTPAVNTVTLNRLRDNVYMMYYYHADTFAEHVIFEVDDRIVAELKDMDYIRIKAAFDELCETGTLIV